MVNPGGESTMLGHWRIVLRQAEEAARVGRFEEAFALATRPDVADHHHAVQFRSRLALDLIARATRRGAVDDLGGAIEDLDLAERMGAPPDSLAAARLSLADRVAEEVRADLDAGDPARALERIEDLARHKVSGPALRRTREIAEAWQAALAEGRRGEFGRAQEQLDRAERLAGGAGAVAAQQAVAAAKAELEIAAEGGRPQGRGAVQRPLRGEVAGDPLGGRGRAGGRPRAPGGASGAVAGLAADRRDRPGRRRAVARPRGPRGPGASPSPTSPPRTDREPRHVDAKPPQARRPGRRHRLARRRGTVRRSPGRGGLAPAATTGPPGRSRCRASPPARPARWPAAEAAGPRGRFLLWVDGVGGYLVCMDDRIVLGRAGPDSHADIPLDGRPVAQPRDARPQRRGLPAPGPPGLVRQRQAGRRAGRPPRRRRDPAGLDRRAGVPPAQPGQRHGAAGDRQPASAAAGGRRRAPDGRDLHRRRGGAGAHPGPGARRSGRPLPPGRRALVPGRRRLRRGRPNLRRPGPADLAFQRAGRRFLLQPGAAGHARLSDASRRRVGCEDCESGILEHSSAIPRAMLEDVGERERTDGRIAGSRWRGTSDERDGRRTA